MASAEVLTLTDLITSTRSLPGSSTIDRFSLKRFSGVEHPFGKDFGLRSPGDDLVSAFGDSGIMGINQKPGQLSQLSSFSPADLLAFPRAESRQFHDFNLGDVKAQAWSADTFGSLRCRDAQFLGKFSDSFKVEGFQLPKNNSQRLISSDAEFFASPGSTPLTKGTGQGGVAFASGTPLPRATEGAGTAADKGCALAELSAQPAEGLTVATEKSSEGDGQGLDYITELLQSGMQLSLTDSKARLLGLQAAIESDTEGPMYFVLERRGDDSGFVLAEATNSGEWDSRQCCEETLRHAEVAGRMSREAVEDENSSLLPGRAKMPHAESILRNKAASGAAGRAGEKSNKRVRWRDRHGEMLVAIREYVVEPEDPEAEDDCDPAEEEGVCWLLDCLISWSSHVFQE